jgi:hypothetical protein
VKVVTILKHKKKNMKSKYFTPDIEDLRVGYECEWKDCYEDSWIKKVNILGKK